MPKTDVAKIKGMKTSETKIIMFADGFIDEVWEIVKSRTSQKDFSIYTVMNEYADRIKMSGSGGVGFELIKKRRVFGGFTANIGYAAARLGIGTTMVGVYGKDKIDSCFDQVAEICNVYSVTDAAITHVFEFDDGKLLMSYMEAVQDLTWQSIVDRMGMDAIKKLLAESDIIGVGYWSLLPAFDEIFENVAQNVPDDGKKRKFFFDFADFRKKDTASLTKSLELLRKYNPKVPMILSVNEHEGAALFAIYNETLDGGGDAIAAKTEIVRKQTGLDELVIHTPYYGAAAWSSGQTAYVESVYCEKPVRGAGAGDSFNGGYIAARLAGFDIAECLDIANNAVGYFLRTGIYPDVDELLGYVK